MVLILVGMIVLVLVSPMFKLFEIPTIGLMIVVFVLVLILVMGFGIGLS